MWALKKTDHYLMKINQSLSTSSLEFLKSTHTVNAAITIFRRPVCGCGWKFSFDEEESFGPLHFGLRNSITKQLVSVFTRPFQKITTHCERNVDKVGNTDLQVVLLSST